MAGFTVGEFDGLLGLGKLVGEESEGFCVGAIEGKDDTGSFVGMEVTGTLDGIDVSGLTVGLPVVNPTGGLEG